VVEGTRAKNGFTNPEIAQAVAGELDGEPVGTGTFSNLATHKAFEAVNLVNAG
jgi:hypothetical protein